MMFIYFLFRISYVYARALGSNNPLGDRHYVKWLLN